MAKETEHKKQSKSARKYLLDKSPQLLIAMSIACMVIGIYMAVHRHKADVATINHAIANGTAPSTNKPAPAEIDNYKVAPDMPRYIIIPSQKVKARVTVVGLTKDGHIGTPANVHDTAWYNGTSKPGQPGASLIDGHVSSWTTKGVFYNIAKLRTGESIQIQRGDGTVLNFVVIKTQTYDANNVDMSAVLSPINQKKPGLNLITCGGQVIKGTNDFDKRVVVFTEQI